MSTAKVFILAPDNEQSKAFDQDKSIDTSQNCKTLITSKTDIWLMGLILEKHSLIRLQVQSQFGTKIDLPLNL